MPPKELLPEIWVKVIKYLRRPLPPPNGRNKRSAIRQPDLASAMRVSKLFNTLTASVLYSIIVTDNLPSLLYGIDRLPTLGVKTKAELLAYMTQLYLEYIPKSRPTYRELMVHGSPLFTIVDIPAVKPSRAEIYALAEAESNSITTGISRLTQLAIDGGLPKLRKYAACAFLGGQPEVWEGVWRGGDPDGTWGKVSAARLAMTVFQNTVDIEAVCHRGVYGPLAGPAHLVAERGPGRKSFKYFAAHIESSSATAPIRGGMTNRWYFDQCKYASESKMEKIYQDMYAILGEVSKTRRGLRRSGEKKGADLSHKVEMYVPLQKWEPWQKAPTKADIKTAETGLEMRWKAVAEDASGDRGAYKDDWKWRFLTNAPRCDACGWCTDNL